MSRVRFHGMNAINKIVEVIWWGIGWEGYSNELTVQENIMKLDEKPDLIVGYKPLEMMNFKDINKPKCLRYNEMDDKIWTIKEITESGANFVVCHHKNDLPYYQNYFGDKVKFIHIPHSAEKLIFKDYGFQKTIDLLLVGKLSAPYVLRKKIQKLFDNKKLKSKYKCVIFPHPGYDRDDSDTDKYAIEFAKKINSAKITITCNTIYKYRLAKYVEIPMSASALAADLPDQDHDEFKEFMIVLDTKMKNKEILDKLIYYLENDDERQVLVEKGLKWAKNYTQEKYAEKFVKAVREFLKTNNKNIWASSTSFFK